MRRLAGAALASALGGLVGIAAHRVANTEYPWNRSGSSASTILHDPQWPAEFPITAEHLKRLDETKDAQFYSQPRITHHIDEEARKVLQAHYRAELPKGGAVLDLMSSWTSHLAEGAGAKREDGHFARLAALGMNEAELRANPAAHDYHVQDLNREPSLAMFADESFDAVVCSVSVDYLSQPMAVLAEVRRVLRPGGLLLFTWSNRMFPTKAIAALRLASEPERLWICGAYVHYTGGFTPPVGEDLSPSHTRGRTDPVYAVHARKLPLAAAATAKLAPPTLPPLVAQQDEL